MKRSYLALILAILLIAPSALAQEWKSFVTVEQLKAKLDAKSQDLVVVDARSADEYRRGHIPGAISLPGKDWRTPSTPAGQGQSQYIFRTSEGAPDVARYERFLGEAGIDPQDEVIVYGNHAGKTDGSVPALLLDWLGHEKVAFLDGVGIEEWKLAGNALSTQEVKLQPTTYTAKPKEGYVWLLNDVLENLKDPDVVFYDTRNRNEYLGKDLRDNRFGGHIPGAVLVDYAELLDWNTKRVVPVEKAKEILQKNGLTPDKHLVLYCQTATRVSLPALVLRDLGYSKVSIYDGSWHEYGNLETTPIANKVEASKG